MQFLRSATAVTVATETAPIELVSTPTATSMRQIYSGRTYGNGVVFWIAGGLPTNHELSIGNDFLSFTPCGTSELDAA